MSDFQVSELNWVHPGYAADNSSFEFTGMVQVRHKHRGVPARVKVENGVASVHFLEEWTSLAPGQAAVFFDTENRELLGGGRIQARVSSSNSILQSRAA